MVLHFDLRDLRSRDGSHGGNEAMHFRIQRNLFDETGPVGLERAAVILDRHSGDFGNQGIGDTRRDLARDQLVLPVEAPADDDVVTLVDLAQQRTYIRGIVLQITIHGHDYIAARLGNACRHRWCLSIVAAELYETDPRIGPCDLVRNPHGRIAAAVIDKHDLERDTERGNCVCDRPIERTETLLLVIERYDDG